MPSFRKSTKCQKANTNELYVVPAGKSASVSVAVQNPKKFGLYVQKTSIPDNSFGAPTQAIAGLSGLNAVAQKAMLGAYSLFSVADPVATSFSTADAIHVIYGDLNPDAIYGQVAYGTGGLTALAPPVYKLRSIPFIDYNEANIAANNKDNSTVFVQVSGNGIFIKKASIREAYRTSDLGLVYSTTPTYFDAGGAAFGSSAVSVRSDGWHVLFCNSITGAGVSVSSNVTSGTNTPAGIASSMAILSGSPQWFMDGATLHFWCSSFKSGFSPRMCWLSLNALEADGVVNGSWGTPGTTGLSAIGTNAKLYWCRTITSSDATKYYVVGAVDGAGVHKVGISTSFSGTFTFTTVTSIDCCVPPIRVNATTLVSRQNTTGITQQITLGGTTVTVGNYTGAKAQLTSLFNTTAQPHIQAAYTALGVSAQHIAYNSLTDVQLLVENVGLNRVDKYSLVVPHLSRDVSADLLVGASRNLERTNLVLEAGDRLYAYTESDNTICHVYGFEE